jgi:hypothetical protein
MTPSLIALTELLKLQKNGQFPDESVRIDVYRALALGFYWVGTVFIINR